MKKSILQFIMFGACAAIFGMAATISAEDTATLKGKFLFDGTPPEPEQLDCKKEPACCQEKLFSETLVVNDKKEVANVIVFARTKLAVPPELAKAHKEPVLLDNKNCRFQPHVVGLVKGQKLIIGNSDTVGHNTNTGETNPIVPAGQKYEYEPKTITLTVPKTVNCNIHPWMSAVMLVRPDPFFAISSPDGTFEIKGLPTGKEIEFQAWHERAGFVTTVKLNDKAATWDKGRFKQKLKAGDNDLGSIKVAPKNFK